MILSDIDLEVFKIINTFNKLPFKIIQKHIVNGLEVNSKNYANNHDKEIKVINVMRKDLEETLNNLEFEEYILVKDILTESYFEELKKYATKWKYSISKLLIHDYYYNVPKSFEELKSKPYRKFNSY